MVFASRRRCKKSIVASVRLKCQNRLQYSVCVISSLSSCKDGHWRIRCLTYGTREISCFSELNELLPYSFDRRSTPDASGDDRHTYVYGTCSSNLIRLTMITYQKPSEVAAVRILFNPNHYITEKNTYFVKPSG